MPNTILTCQNLARHLELKRNHDYWERQYHISRNQIMEELKDIGAWSQDGFKAMIVEHQSKRFQIKPFTLAYPDLYEEFLKAIPSRQLHIIGPDLEPSEDTVGHRPAPPTPIFPQAVHRKGYVQTLIEQQLGPNGQPSTTPKRNLQRVIADLMRPDEEMIE